MIISNSRIWRISNATKTTLLYVLVQDAFWDCSQQLWFAWDNFLWKLKSITTQIYVRNPCNQSLVVDSNSLEWSAYRVDYGRHYTPSQMNFQVRTSSLQILSWGHSRVCEWRPATWKLYHSIQLCNPLLHYSFWKLGSTQLVGRWLCQISLLQVGTVSIRSRALINSCNVSVFLAKPFKNIGIFQIWCSFEILLRKCIWPIYYPQGQLHPTHKPIGSTGLN